MSVINDAEFGEIIVRRTPRMRSIRIKIGTDGRYIASAPAYTPLYFIRRTINSSRSALRNLARQSQLPGAYIDGQQIGKRHALAVVPTQMVKEPVMKIERQKIIILLPPGRSLEEPPIQQQIRDSVVKVLRREAKTYLPRRLKYLAQTHGFHYERVRLSHAGSRWGSCSSTGTISLNIALMKLPHELIDYVLIHELSHTRQMNHSRAFWTEVKSYDALYKLHRQQLKRETPAV